MNQAPFDQAVAVVMRRYNEETWMQGFEQNTHGNGKELLLSTVNGSSRISRLQAFTLSCRSIRSGPGPTSMFINEHSLHLTTYENSTTVYFDHLSPENGTYEDTVPVNLVARERCAVGLRLSTVGGGRRGLARAGARRRGRRRNRFRGWRWRWRW